MILQNFHIFAASTINISKYLAIFRKLTLFRPGSGFLSLVSRGLWLLFTWNHSKAYKIDLRVLLADVHLRNRLSG